jgi:hypothetical protein
MLEFSHFKAHHLLWGEGGRLLREMAGCWFIGRRHCPRRRLAEAGRCCNVLPSRTCGDGK